MQILLDLSELIYWFFTEGLLEYADSVLVAMGAHVVVWYLKIKLYGLQLAIGIATEVITTIGITGAIETSFNSLDSKTLQVVSFFKIPQCIEIIMSGWFTRMILGMVT